MADKQQLDLEVLGQQIADGVAAGLAANAPKRKMTIGEYTRMHNAGRVKLLRPVFQNGIPVLDRVLSNEEIRLLNQITRSGRYFERNLEVIVSEDVPGQEPSVDIRYHNKTSDQRNMLTRFFTSLKDMLEKIVVLQAQEDAEPALVRRR